MKTVFQTFLLGFLGLTLTANAGGILEELKPSKIKERIKEEYAELDTGFDIDLLDIDLFKGLGISSRYRYEVEPGYQKDLHTRIDRWEIKAKLSPGDILSGSLDTPLYLNIERGAEVFFVRHFKNKFDSIKAKPYTLKRLPLKAKHALRHLKPGDFVSMPTNLNVVLGASGSTSHAGTLGVDAGANVYYMMAGRFLVHVYRLKGNKVRLKLISSRERKAGANANIGGSLSIFGVKIIDKAVEDVFELDFVQLGLAKSRGRQFVLDYVFDLSDERAVKAYNNILASTFKFKDVSAFTQNFNGGKLKDKLISTYELADNIHFEDSEKEQPSVKRLFKGINKYEQKAGNLKLGLVVAKFKGGRSYTENNLQYENDRGELKNFFYPIQTISYQQQIGLGILFKYKEEINQSLFGLVPTGVEDNGSSFSDFGMSYTRKDKSFRDDEQAHVKEMLTFSLPTQVLEKIDWKDWTDFDTKRSARISYQLVLKASAFKAMPKLTQKELKEKLYEFYKTRTQYAGNILDLSWDKLVNFVTVKKITKKWKLKALAKKVHKAIYTEGISGKERINMFMELRNSYASRKILLGFLSSLIPAEKLEDHIQVKLNVIAKDRQEVVFKYGNQNLSKLYYQMQHVQNAINNRSYDLRLNHEENNLDL